MVDGQVTVLLLVCATSTAAAAADFFPLPEEALRMNEVYGVVKLAVKEDEDEERLL